MAWKGTGRPTGAASATSGSYGVDGIDTTTGKETTEALPESVRTVTDRIGQRDQDLYIACSSNRKDRITWVSTAAEN
jgi:hypothetical protein